MNNKFETCNCVPNFFIDSQTYKVCRKKLLQFDLIDEINEKFKIKSKKWIQIDSPYFADKIANPVIFSKKLAFFSWVKINKYIRL